MDERHPPEPKNLLINVGAELLDKIEAFRYSEKFPTRAEAIRWLIEFALKQKPKRTR